MLSTKKLAIVGISLVTLSSSLFGCGKESVNETTNKEPENNVVQEMPKEEVNEHQDLIDKYGLEVTDEGYLDPQSGLAISEEAFDIYTEEEIEAQIEQSREYSEAEDNGEEETTEYDGIKMNSDYHSLDMMYTEMDLAVKQLNENGFSTQCISDKYYNNYHIASYYLINGEDTLYIDYLADSYIPYQVDISTKNVDIQTAFDEFVCATANIYLFEEESYDTIVEAVNNGQDQVTVEGHTVFVKEHGFTINLWYEINE